MSSFERNNSNAGFLISKTIISINLFSLFLFFLFEVLASSESSCSVRVCLSWSWAIFMFQLNYSSLWRSFVFPFAFVGWLFYVVNVYGIFLFWYLMHFVPIALFDLLMFLFFSLLCVDENELWYSMKKNDEKSFGI